MAICSHCGRQSQANALTCEFCGYPLTAEVGDISGQDTVFTAPSVGENQNGAESTPVVAKITVRPLQDASGLPRDFALTGQNISIGRSPSCEIVLDHDQLTSRRHALLRYDGGQYTVVDLGSSNGTFVNDAEIRDATLLNSGDRIIVGEHELTFSTDVAEMAPIAGIDLNGAPPSSPLGTTGSQSALRPDQSEQEPIAADEVSAADEADEADTTYMNTIAAPLEAAPADMADSANVDDVSAVSDAADVADVADVGDVADVADVADVGDVSDVADVSEDAGAPASDGAAQEEHDSSLAPSAENIALLAHAPSSGALRQPGGELDQLRAQLAQLAATSEAVAQHAAEETDLSEKRRQALAETRDQLHAILAGIHNASNQASEAESDASDSGDSGDLSDLIALSEQAATDPNHLQNVSRLAEHASEITRALQALQARRIQPPRPTAEENALAELRALQARLDDLA